jgi:ABC-2 type transport system permease protein
MNQFAAFLRKEFLHMFRDRRTLLMLFGIPVVLIMLFGFALTNEIKHTRIAVCDLARDGLSAHIVRELDASRHFDLERVLLSPTELDAAFKTGRIRMAVILPPKLEEDLAHTGSAKIQLVADASDPNIATTIVGYATRILQDAQATSGIAAPWPVRIETETRMMYNPELKGSTNFVPGVMSMILLIVCVLMTSIAIVREKERGTMEVLLVSPFHPMLVLITKAIPYLFLSVVNLGVILLLSATLLDLPVRGSLFVLFGASMTFIIACLALGLLISNVTKTQEAAMVISLVGMLLPSVILTGFMFPVENMPKVLQIMSNVILSKYYFIIVKNVMIKGLGFAAVWKEAAVLLGMATGLLAIALLKFKKRLA